MKIGSFGMEKTLLWAGVTLIFLGAIAPTYPQVTTLDSGDVTNLPHATATVPGKESVAPDYTSNSLIVTGPVNKLDAVPSVDLDKFSREYVLKPGTPDASPANKR
jgi:hypothetical protein